MDKVPRGTTSSGRTDLIRHSLLFPGSRKPVACFLPTAYIYYWGYSWGINPHAIKGELAGEEELGAGRGRAKRGEELQSLEDCSTC